MDDREFQESFAELLRLERELFAEREARFQERVEAKKAEIAPALEESMRLAIKAVYDDDSYTGRDGRRT